MEGIAQRKVPGGKLVKVWAKAREGRIQEVRITGDFFLHPEEAILDVESCLRGIGMNEKTEDIEKRIDRVLRERGGEFIGMEPRDIALALKEALS